MLEAKTGISMTLRACCFRRDSPQRHALQIWTCSEMEGLSFLFLVAWPGATSSVLAPSSDALCS